MKVLSLLRAGVFLAAVVGMDVAMAKHHRHRNCADVSAKVDVAGKVDIAGKVDAALNLRAPAPAGPANGGGAVPATPAAPTTAPAPYWNVDTSSGGPMLSFAKGGAADKITSNAGNVKSKFSYTGKDAGGPGSYNMVTDVASCAKVPHAMHSAISPLDDDVTLVFRGPLKLFNIAIFDGSNGTWSQVSSYKRGGEANNLVFLNNHNVDFSGKSAPQGFATADGKGTAKQSTKFEGDLAAASNPHTFSFDAAEKTGVEVNIFQDKPCGKDGNDCVGYFDKDGTAMRGWSGGKKVFVTKVQMPRGGSPDLPAIWMLNGQIVRSNQYQCNCRGMGQAGGCGEFDIAEVLERDTSKVATHYYFYDGKVQTAPGDDTWAKRPIDAPVTYVTLIDESYGIKVLELGADDFDFGATAISADVIAKWEKA